MSDAWTDIPPTGGKLRPCIICEKPTNSHGVALSDEGDSFEPCEPGEGDFLYAVCHTCFMAHDGDAESVADKLNEDRSEVLDNAGITPAVIGDMKSLEEMDTERVKAIGSSTAGNMVYRLKPGDVVEINDTGIHWVVAPVSDDVKAKFDHTMEWAILSAGDSEAGAGGIVQSLNPFDDRIYVATTVGDNDSVDFEPIESMELIGSTDFGLDEIEWDGELA